MTQLFNALWRIEDGGMATLTGTPYAERYGNPVNGKQCHLPQQSDNCKDVVEAIFIMITRSIVGKCQGAISRLVGGDTVAAADNAASPFLVEFFMVQGMGFQCMAYRSPDGIWRSAFDNRELPGAIRVLE
jgi:hypothetical protein